MAIGAPFGAAPFDKLRTLRGSENVNSGEEPGMARQPDHPPQLKQPVVVRDTGIAGRSGQIV